MKTKNLKATMFDLNKSIMSTAAMLALVLTLLPTTSRAEAVTDTTSTQKTKTEMTVNGRPATQQEKAVARAMVRQGGRMAGKGVQLAAAAITNPQRAEEIGAELEAMGDEMERMGDSLEALADDTTFLYEGEDEDSVALSDADVDDIISDLKREFNLDFDFGQSWWSRLLAGGLGLLIGGIAIVGVLLLVVLILGIVTAPLWIAGLILYLILRNDRKVKKTRMQSEQFHTANVDAPINATEDGATAMPQSEMAMNTDTENQEICISGVRQCCIGVGLIVFFVAIGWNGFWGIGALVACLGVAKLIIAYSSKRKY